MSDSEASPIPSPRATEEHDAHAQQAQADSHPAANAAAANSSSTQDEDDSGLSSVGLGPPRRSLASESSALAVQAPSLRVDASPGHVSPPPQPLVFTNGPAGVGALLASSSGSPVATGGATPVLTPFELLCPGPEARLTDYSRVTHSFQSVHAQVVRGLDTLHSVAEFVRRTAGAKSSYAAELLKTSGQYAGRSGAVAGAGSSTHTGAAGGTGGASGTAAQPAEDCMGSAARVWGELREHLFEEARTEQELASKLLADVVAPMMSFHADASRKARVLATHHHALAGQMRALTEGQLLQAKIAAVKAIAAMHAAEQREREQAAAHIARLAASPADALIPLAPPPVHLKSFEESGGLGGMSKRSSGNASDSASSSSAGKSFEHSTRKALASVGSFFSRLGSKKESNTGAAGAIGAAAGAPAGSTTAGAALPSSSPDGSAPTTPAAFPDVAPASSAASSAPAVSVAAADSSSSSEELRERAYQSALAYQLAVASSNARQDQFYRHDLPQLFADLQRLEIARCNCLKHYLAVMAQANLSLLGPTKQRLQSLVQSCAAVNGSEDTRAYATELVSQLGEAVQPNGFKYDLDLLPAGIRSGQTEVVPAAPVVPQPPSSAPGEVPPAGSLPGASPAAGDSSSSSNAVSSSSFSAPLSVQMDHTHEESEHLPHSADLDVPRPLFELLAAIRKRRGQCAQGLFQTAAPRGEIDALRRRFEAGQYDTESVALEVLAATLREWIRGLPEPLLPSPLYNACVQAVRKDAAAQLAERHAQAEAAAAAAAKPAQGVDGGAPVASLDGVDRPRSAAAAAAASAPSALSPTAAAAAAASKLMNEALAVATTPRSSSSASSASSGSAPALPPPSQSLLPSPQLHQYVQSIFSALPTLNQRVVTQLALLLSDMAQAGSQLQIAPGGAGAVKGSDADAAATSAASSASGPSGSASAGAGASPAVVTDWSRWAYLMSRESAPFCSALLRSSQADATDLLSNARSELRFVAALLISVAAQARVQRIASSTAAVNSADHAVPAFIQPPFTPPPSSQQQQREYAHASPAKGTEEQAKGDAGTQADHSEAEPAGDTEADNA